MCEQTSTAVVYGVGYVLPVACCLAGACMSCYGCYRYYRANELRRRRTEMTQQFEVAQLPDNLPRLQRNTLKKTMLKAFAKFTGNKNKDILGGNITAISLKDMRDACPICMDAYQGDPKEIFIGLIKTCGHYFHFECLWNWLEVNQTCPICRIRCDLSENDLHGVTLEQVLTIAVKAEEYENIADKKLSTVDNENETNNRNSDSIQLQVLHIDARDIYRVHTHNSMTSQRQYSPTASNTAIIMQPRSTSSELGGPRVRNSALIERMRQRFEGTGVNGAFDAEEDEEGQSPLGDSRNNENNPLAS